jgi:hypothetical protein
MKTRAKEATLTDIFLFLYLLILILWLTTETHYERQIRFLFPVAGILLVYGYLALGFLLDRITPRASHIILKTVLIILIAANALYIGKNIAFNDDDIGKAETRELAGWVKENMGPDDHYYFYQPWTLAYLTGRTGVALWMMEEGARRESPARLLERLKGRGVFFIILSEPGDGYLIKAFASGAYPARQVFDNGQFKVYRIQR